VHVFVNYRREDTSGDARLLYERLSARFGEPNVLFDVREEPGIDWLAEIRANGSRGGAFLALIGPSWLSILHDRRGAGIRQIGTDFVRQEIEWALREWPGHVIPVLVDATMPEALALPRSIRGLCRKQAAVLRHASLDRDVAALIERLERIAREGSDLDDLREPLLDGAAGERRRSSAAATTQAASGVPAPHQEHFAAVIDGIIEGSVVPVLGSSLRGALPDAEQLAGHIARTFNLERGSRDLAEVAQYIAVTQGERRLYMAMREVFASGSQPTEVHRFLASLPRMLRELDLPARPQMIVSAAYDNALERAFEDTNEPFDYAVYLASRGWFMHCPWGEHDAEPAAITINEPYKYADFPIDDDGEPERTVIVKIHGAVEGQEGDSNWVDDYVVTEDQYIDYLPTDNIHKLIPVQILAKLKSSGCLFLGYAMRDWNARVFLRRVWQGESMSEKSWAIENQPDVLERDSWGLVGHVELLAASLPDYVGELRDRLMAMHKAPA
jgi:SIR2-like domain/TIR domain